LVVLQQAIVGFVGGIVGSIATAFVGHPIYSFITLRTKTAAAISRYERVHTLFAPPDQKWFADRKIAYEVCGSDLVSFAASNDFLTKIFNKCGYDIHVAGDDLLVLSQTVHGDAEAITVQERVATALKLKVYPL